MLLLILITFFQHIECHSYLVYSTIVSSFFSIRFGLVSFATLVLLACYCIFILLSSLIVGVRVVSHNNSFSDAPSGSHLRQMMVFVPALVVVRTKVCRGRPEP